MARGGDVYPRTDGERSVLSQGTSTSSALPSSPTLHDEYDLTSASDMLSDGADEEAWEGFDGQATSDIMSQYQNLRSNICVVGGSRSI